MADQDDSQNDTNDNNEEQPAPQSIDDVIENETNDDGSLKDEGSDDENEDDEGKDDKGSGDEEESDEEGDSEEKPDGEEDAEDDDESEGDDTPDTTEDDEEEEEPAKPPQPEDNDITKPGEGKVPIESEDGTKYYLRRSSDLDQLPDDWEPKSYKELAKISSQLARNDQRAEEEAAEQLEREEKERKEKAIEAERERVQKGWRKEITEMQTDGNYPKKEKEANELTRKVVEFMRKEADEGRTFNSFQHAYKLMKAEEAESEANKKKEQEKNDRKKVANNIAGSGYNDDKPGSSKGADLRKGMSLDDVLEEELYSN